MPIWVDADACPKAIKDILFRAAEPGGNASAGRASAVSDPDSRFDLARTQDP